MSRLPHFLDNWLIDGGEVVSLMHTLKDTWHLGRQMSHLSIQTTLDSFFKPALLCSKTSKTSKSSIDE
jgi:hypothetical protein